MAASGRSVHLDDVIGHYRGGHQHLGLPQLVDRHLDLGRAPGRANTGDKVMTLVASALAGGDCIDDADVLRGTAGAIGCVVKGHPPWGPFTQLPVGMSASWTG